MKEEVRKQLGEPENELEKDTLAYIEPLITEMIGEDIIGKGLTLEGCTEHCFKKGKKFEVRSENRGYARISDEQHFAWVREYFGINNTDVQTPRNEAADKPKALELDFDNLLDFDKMSE